MGKRKPKAATADEPEEKRGGGGRGAGRKRSDPALGGGQKDLHGNDIPTKTQVSLAA